MSRFVLKVLQACVVTSAIVICTSANARLPEPTFPVTIVIPSTDLILSKIGEHRYIYNMFFKVYDVALYADSSSEIKDILDAKTSYRLQFRYLRKIDRSIILKSSAKMLAKNLAPEEYDQIAVRLNYLNANYQSVENGDRSSLTYQLGVGTTLSINGLPIITIKGQDFAKLYFTIWLGKLPISKILKQDLLDFSD